MEDVQNRPDERGVAIDHVGISDLRYPIVVLDRANERQHTVARLNLSVSLPQHFKGTHMSRFVEVLAKHRGELTMHTLPAILVELSRRLSAESARIEANFPYFIERAAPVTGAKALMDYECGFVGEVRSDREDFLLRVVVPVTSVCPCSKAISDYGAHNQRGRITIEVRCASTERGPALVWIEELVEIAEGAASAPVFPLVKRPDERFLTMKAYDNPVFVEDMVRNVALRLRSDSRIAWFRVHAHNDESIHNHSAFAELTWTRVVKEALDAAEQVPTQAIQVASTQ